MVQQVDTGFVFEEGFHALDMSRVRAGTCFHVCGPHPSRSTLRQGMKEAVIDRKTTSGVHRLAPPLRHGASPLVR